jgi:hypothetical protein
MPDPASVAAASREQTPPETSPLRPSTPRIAHAHAHARQPATGPREAESGARLNGVVDVVRSGRIAGWAIDRSDPNAAVDVEIYNSGQKIADVRADRYREDLEKGGIGTGKYGFVVEIEPPIEAGMGFAVSATARAADGTRGALRPIGKASPSLQEDRRLQERIFEELVSLRALLGAPPPAPAGPAEDGERVRLILDRIELVQARLEGAVTRSVSADPPRADGGLRIIAGLALVIATLSLASGLFSMLAP